ncbi:MAG: AMP-binding protein [Rhodocyclaceae bacterium]|nr:AMP-binding protein [Rhodocyclaceae bacterium]
MARLVQDRLTRFADRTFLILPDGDRRYSYAEFGELVRRAAGLLADAGLSAGDHAVMALKNSPENIALFLAALATGVRPLLMGSDYSAGELEGAIEGLPVRIVFVDAGVFVEGRLPAAGRLTPMTVAAGFAGSAGREPFAAMAGIATDDPAYIMCSSGSTGRPKRISISQRNMIAELKAMVTAYGLGGDDRHLCVLPLFHASGMYRNVLMPFWQGGATVLCEAFEQETFWPLVSRHEVNFVQVVPSVLAVLADQEAGPDARARHSLKYIGSASAPLSPKLVERFEARFGIPVVQGFGLTELTCGITLNETDPARRKVESVGRPLAVNEVRIMDEAGRFLPPGEEGEVVVRGDNVMLGYLGPDGHPASPWQDGWFHTNDLGHLDADGFVYLTGRKSDIINRGGHKISPVEVEKVLMQHPAVKDVVVIGLPHEMLGEDVVACLVKNTGAALGGTELLHFAQERLPAFKVPTSFHFLDKLPRTGPGKINRRAFAATMAHEVAAASAPAVGGPQLTGAALAQRVREIVAEVFSLPVDKVTDELGPHKLRAWDSLGQIRLVLALEDGFVFRHDPREANAVRNVGELIAMVTRRASAGA